MHGKHVCMLTTMPNISCKRPLVSRWRRLCRSARLLTLPSAWHHGSRVFLRSEKALEVERNRQLAASSKLIIHPYSLFKLFWDCYVTLILSIALLYMPFQVFYECPDPYDPFILFNDVMGWMTIVLNFFTGAIDDDEVKKISLERTVIASKYLRSTFFFDMLGSMPLQCIYIYHDCKFPIHTVMYLFKLFRLVRLGFTWKNLSCQFGMSYILMMGIIVTSRTIIFFHWMTFCHYQVPVVVAHYIKEREGLFLLWLQRYKVVTTGNETLTLLDKYVSNLYYVSGICIGAGVYTTGKNNAQTTAEQLVTAIMGVVGLIFMIYFFTTLLRLTVYKYYEYYLYNGRLKELQEYLNFKQVPKTLQQKIQFYINYRFNGQYFNEKTILNTINVQIKQEINMFCCKKLIMNVPLFQDMPVALINTIIFSLTQVLYMPGEVVVKYGHPGSSIYLIYSGTVAIMNAEGKEIGHLKDGAFFGERALLVPGAHRNATIVALEISELYKLHHTKFQACLQPCPRLKRRLEEAAIKMYADTLPQRQASTHSAGRYSNASSYG